MPINYNIAALILLVDGTEWDRARIYNGSYTLEAAIRQMEEWKQKVRREDPEARIEVVASLDAGLFEW